MSKLAQEARISKALLYHYFPSKRRLFEAALEEGAEELRRRTEPEPGRPPAEQLAKTLDAFLVWVQERPKAYATLLDSSSSEVREIVAEVRDDDRGPDPHGPRRGGQAPGDARRRARLARLPRRRDPRLDRPRRPQPRGAARHAARRVRRRAHRLGRERRAADRAAAGVVVTHAPVLAPASWRATAQGTCDPGGMRKPVSDRRVRRAAVAGCGGRGRRRARRARATAPQRDEGNPLELPANVPLKPSRAADAGSGGGHPRVVGRDARRRRSPGRARCGRCRRRSRTARRC